MGTGLEIAAWGALAVSAVSAVEQYEQGQRASRASSRQAQAQKDALAAQGRVADVEAQRARVAQAREARIRRAQVLAATTDIGGGSSGISGATGSISSQAASNIGLINQTQTFSAQASAANQRAADAGAQVAEHQATAQQWGAIGNLSMSALNIVGKENLFKKTS